MKRFRITYKEPASDGTRSHILPIGTHLDESNGELLILQDNSRSVFIVIPLNGIVHLPEGESGKYYKLFITPEGHQIKKEGGWEFFKIKRLLVTALALASLKLEAAPLLQMPLYEKVFPPSHTHTLTRHRDSLSHHLKRHRAHPSFTYRKDRQPLVNDLS